MYIFYKRIQVAGDVFSQSRVCTTTGDWTHTISIISCLLLSCKPARRDPHDQLRMLRSGGTVE